MFRHPACLLLGLLSAASPAQELLPEDRDLLRFLNGDVLHGRFEGMENSSSVTWSGSSIKTPIVLQSSTLRRMTLNGGRPGKALPAPEFIELVNGDQIPGRVIELNESNLTIETALAGSLTVERRHVASISPNPFGGTLHYIGPFTPDQWTILEDAPTPEGGQVARQRRVENPADKEAEDPWVFGGDAWYSNGQAPITLDADLPDKARISFRLAWRNRLSAVVAFHATLEIPEKKEANAEGDEEVVQRAPNTNTSSYPLTYGPSYVLTVFASYAMLYRCEFDEAGNATMTRLTNSSANIRLDESGEADFELRCDRNKRSILLFVNGEYVNQWEDLDGYAGTGSHLAFACQNNTSRLRVSDVVVTSWNGMIDSARSMDAEDRDMVLLSNGTDRFSGHLAGLQDGRYLLKGAYADMQIPTSEVETIHFARTSRDELPAPSDKAVRVVFQPIGRLTVDPVSATSKELVARHPALGDLTLDFGYASLLEFAFGDSILDSWDEDF